MQIRYKTFILHAYKNRKMKMSKAETFVLVVPNFLYYNEVLVNFCILGAFDMPQRNCV